LERLHASFPRLQYDRELPCPCQECAENGQPFRFPLRVLGEAARRGKPLQCHRSYEMVDASALVRDILPHVSLLEPTVAVRQELPAVPTEPGREVFVSYAVDAASRPLVKQLHTKLSEHDVRLYDYKKDIDYKQSVGEFMTRLGQAGCVIVILSDKYLRSEYCMFELLEIAAAESFRERVFPIVLADAKLHDASERVGYVEHWEQQEAKLDAKLKGVKGAKLQNLQRTLNLYANVRNLFDDLSDRLADMNALTPDEHENAGFDQLVAAVIRRVGRRS
jgi:hypothetical protein